MLNYTVPPGLVAFLLLYCPFDPAVRGRGKVKEDADRHNVKLILLMKKCTVGIQDKSQYTNNQLLPTLQQQFISCH